MTIKELQEKTDAWIQTFGVRYFNEMTNTAILAEEVGELSSLMARVYGEQSFKAGQEPQDVKSKIAEELSDIIFVVSCLSNQMNIDLEEAIEKNFNKKTKRDNERHKQNKKL